jgi:hypothetical protein
MQSQLGHAEEAMPNYPYISGQAGLLQAFSQLRKGFPTKVDAGYLQRFNIAPANESYVISILRFLGLIDEEGNRVQDETDYFFGNDDSFKSGLESTLRKAYSQVFDEMGDAALDSPKGDLAHWFRASDKTTEIVGQRQASTFQTLAALAGHGELPTVRSGGTKKPATSTPSQGASKAATKKTAPEKQAKKPDSVSSNGGSGDSVTSGQDVGLTVRIEVNLPPGGDADTYDAIFASIKKHLMS